MRAHRHFVGGGQTIYKDIFFGIGLFPILFSLVDLLYSKAIDNLCITLTLLIVYWIRISVSGLTSDYIIVTVIICADCTQYIVFH